RREAERPRGMQVLEAVQPLAKFVHEMRRDAPDDSRYVGTGAAVAGMVRRADGVVRLAPTIGWVEEPVGAALRAELGDHAHTTQFFHGKGCSHCNGMGYRGRTGVYELLEMTAPVVDAANHPDPAHFLRAAHAQMGGDTLRRNGVQLAVQGRSTIAEAMRISNQLDE
ncbi:MAG: hypothetical protein ACLGI6_17035, partial [Gammaproteobacteria bacterium]